MSKDNKVIKKYTIDQIEKFKEDLKRKFKKPTPRKEVMHQIQREPKNKWEIPDKAQKGISFTFTIQMDSLQKGKVMDLIGFSEFIDFTKLDTLLSVFHIPGYFYIKSDNSGAFGQDFAYIKNAEGDLLFLETVHKLYLQFDYDQIPQFKFNRLLQGKIGEKIDISEEIEYKGIKARKIEITIQAPTKVKWTLWISLDPDIKPFAKEVVNTLIACPKICEDVLPIVNKLNEIGFLLKGEVFLYDSHGKVKQKPAITFALDNLKIQEIDPIKFTFPKDYQNLRELRSKKPEKSKLPGKYAIHDFRVGKRIQKSPSFTPSTPINRMEMLKLSAPMIPPCLDSVYDSPVSIEIEQQLLNDIRFLINAVSKRLTNFGGNDGIITINWLDQFKNYSDGTAGGDALYCFLRDEPKPEDPDPEEAVGGKGLLDLLAKAQAIEALINSTILQEITISDGATLGQISGILNDPSILGADRWDSLGEIHQINLREDWLAQKIGKFEFEYPDSTDWISIFHDLLRIKIWDIEFNVGINNQEIIRKLIIENNRILLELLIPLINADANFASVPSTLYYLIAGAGTLACVLFPPLCWLVPLVALVGSWLLLDIAYIGIEVVDCDIDVTLQFTQNAQGYFEPNPLVALDSSDLTFIFQSYIPGTLSAIKSAIISAIGTHTDLIFDNLETQLKKVLKKTLKPYLTFPPTLTPIEYSIIDNNISSDPEKYLNFNAILGNFGTGCIPFITLTSPYIHSMMRHIRNFFAAGCSDTNLWNFAHHCGGFAVSQNLLNVYLYKEWLRGDFYYEFNLEEATELINVLREICPACVLPSPYSINIKAATAPRLDLTPFGFYNLSGYSTTFFDDIRICVVSSDGKLEGGTIEFQFAAKAVSQLGFGGVDNQSNLLDLTKPNGQYVDIYYDLKQIGVQLMHPEVQSVTGIGPGAVPLTINLLGSLDDAFTRAMMLMLAKKSDRLIPFTKYERSHTLNKYHLAGQEIILILIPYRGIIYAQFGFNGELTTILPYNEAGDVFIDIDGEKCEFGEIIRNLLPEDIFGP